MHFQEAAPCEDLAEKEAWVHVWAQSELEEESEALLLEEGVPVQDALAPQEVRREDHSRRHEEEKVAFAQQEVNTFEVRARYI